VRWIKKKVAMQRVDEALSAITEATKRANDYPVQSPAHIAQVHVIHRLIREAEQKLEGIARDYPELTTTPMWEETVIWLADRRRTTDNVLKNVTA
jgi:hypothetical protein